jgi:hypothetical protein
MSLRIDTAELISGAYVIGDTGLGVLGSTVPSTGEHGPSCLYNDLSLPADNDKEVRGLIVTPPAAGAFFAYEDGSFSLVGAPDGAYTFVYRLFVDGVDLGTAAATITIGGAEAVTSLGGGKKMPARRIRWQDYDVPLPKPELLPVPPEAKPTPKPASLRSSNSSLRISPVRS